MNIDDRKKLVKKLGGAKVDKKVTVLPDFFLDNIAEFSGDSLELTKKINEVASRGGGNIPYVPQTFNIGGNAAIFAQTLSLLKCKSHLIVRTSPFGFNCLNYFLKDTLVDINHVKQDSKLSTSLILEVKKDDNKANIMIGDAGGLTDFDYDKLSLEDLDLIRSSDYTCVFNWAQNSNGTSLTSHVFNTAKEGPGKTYLDTSDPSWKINELPSLLKQTSDKGNLDFFSLNENEIKQVCKVLKVKEHNSYIKMAEKLSKLIDVEILVHTPQLTICGKDGEIFVEPTFNLKPVRVTGAGDSWNAGYIFGHACGLNINERLVFANSAAGSHVLNQYPMERSLTDILNMLIQHKQRTQFKPYG